MSGCYYENGGRNSVDPWCRTHARSAICCAKLYEERLVQALKACRLVVDEVGSLHNPDDCPNSACYQDAVSDVLRHEDASLGALPADAQRVIDAARRAKDWSTPGFTDEVGHAAYAELRAAVAALGGKYGGRP